VCRFAYSPPSRRHQEPFTRSGDPHHNHLPRGTPLVGCRVKTPIADLLGRGDHHDHQRIQRTSSSKINLPQRWLAETQPTRWVSNPLDQPTRRRGSATLQISISWRLVKTESTLAQSASLSQKRTSQQAAIRITIKIKRVSIESNFYTE
jgi:hypothetical protein